MSGDSGMLPGGRPWQPPDDLRVELDDAFRFTGPGGVHVSRSRLETLLAREHSRGFTEAAGILARLSQVYSRSFTEAARILTDNATLEPPKGERQ